MPESAKNEEGIFEISNETWGNIKNIVKIVIINSTNNRENGKFEEMFNEPNNFKELIEKVSSFISEGIFIPDVEVSEKSRGALNLGKEIVKKIQN